MKDMNLLKLDNVLVVLMVVKIVLKVFVTHVLKVCILIINIMSVSRIVVINNLMMPNQVLVVFVLMVVQAALQISNVMNVSKDINLVLMEPDVSHVKLTCVMSVPKISVLNVNPDCSLT